MRESLNKSQWSVSQHLHRREKWSCCWRLVRVHTRNELVLVSLLLFVWANPIVMNTENPWLKRTRLKGLIDSSDVNHTYGSSGVWTGAVWRSDVWDGVSWVWQRQKTSQTLNTMTDREINHDGFNSVFTICFTSYCLVSITYVETAKKMWFNSNLKRLTSMYTVFFFYSARKH